MLPMFGVLYLLLVEHKLKWNGGRRRRGGEMKHNIGWHVGEVLVFILVSVDMGGGCCGGGVVEGVLWRDGA